MKPPSLPVSVTERPHWRVNIRPTEYKKFKIGSLQECIKVIEKCRVNLRGWDYPHLSNFEKERGFCDNYVFCFSDFLCLEYWRFYQSTQFIHLFSVREFYDESWDTKLRSIMKGWLSYDKNIDWEKVIGFVSIPNLIYTISEIYEFVSRLCQAQIFEGSIEISISLKMIRDFVLAPEENRVWHSFFQSKGDTIEKKSIVNSNEIIPNGREIAIKDASYFFERFGWLDQPFEIFKKDQERFFQRE